MVWIWWTELVMIRNALSIWSSVPRPANWCWHMSRTNSTLSSSKMGSVLKCRYFNRKWRILKWRSRKEVLEVSVLVDWYRLIWPYISPPQRWGPFSNVSAIPTTRRSTYVGSDWSLNALLVLSIYSMTLWVLSDLSLSARIALWPRKMKIAKKTNYEHFCIFVISLCTNLEFVTIGLLANIIKNQSFQVTKGKTSLMRIDEKRCLTGPDGANSFTLLPDSIPWKNLFLLSGIILKNILNFCDG